MEPSEASPSHPRLLNAYLASDAGSGISPLTERRLRSLLDETGIGDLLKSVEQVHGLRVALDELAETSRDTGVRALVKATVAGEVSRSKQRQRKSR